LGHARRRLPCPQNSADGCSPCVLKCRIAYGFPDDLVDNIQHCGRTFLSVMWQGTLDVSIFHKFKSAMGLAEAWSVLLQLSYQQ
jgi:hypothetical protein